MVESTKQKAETKLRPKVELMELLVQKVAQMRQMVTRARLAEHMVAYNQGCTYVFQPVSHMRTWRFGLVLTGATACSVTHKIYIKKNYNSDNNIIALLFSLNKKKLIFMYFYVCMYVCMNELNN